MAEDEEIMMDDASIAVDDIEKEGVDETKSYNIIPFIMDRYKKKSFKKKSLLKKICLSW